MQPLGQPSFDAGLNTVGNLTSVTDLDNSTVSYAYDPLYRLLGDSRSGTNPTSHSYAYDLSGNRTTVDGGAWNYDAGNKLQSYTSGGTSYTVSSDGDGNLISVSNGRPSPVASFNWDDLNRMTAQAGVSGANSTTYGYDGFGRRVYASGVLTRGPTFYIFDGSQVIGEITTAWGSNPYGQTVVNTWGATGLVSENVTFGPPEPYQGNISLWYAFGPQRETRQLTNAAGAVVDIDTYTAYGSPVASTGTDYNPYRYGGEFGYYTDPGGGNGLILCGARWYSPTLGRWLSRDPIDYAGGDNLYAYCGADPINLIDPSGLQSQCGKRISDWYMNGMGGLSNFVDEFLMFGTTKSFGDTAGRYDSGRASKAELAWSAAKFATMLATNSIAIGKSIVSAPSWVENMVTKRMQAMTDYATANYQSTPNQLRAIAKNPKLAAMFRGERIDYLFSKLLKEDKVLRVFLKQTPRGTFGPDVMLKWGKIWWGVTTEGQWGRHLDKYTEMFGRGIRLCN